MAEAQVLLLSEEEKKKDAYLSLESITYARPIHYEKINDIFNKYNVVITNKDERTLSQYLEKERTDYNDKNLRDEICKAYNENDQDLDLIIYKILFDEFDLGLRKRQKIYDILLHEYFKVIDLKIDNIINVSCTLIKQLKFEDIIDINKFMVIAKKENLNGDKIMGLKNARLFTNLFKSMNVTNSKLAKIFVHFKKKWKAKNYSKMEENEEKKKEERKEQKKEEKKEEEDEEEKDDKKQEESDDINPNQLMEDDKIPHCRDNEVHNIKDPLPKYLYKSIFYRSDETVEALVDYAMLKVLGCNKWRKPNFVKKLYEDTTYFDAVIELYEELNENEFFDKFVKKHAKRELEIWKIKMEETKHIHSKEQIWNILQDTDFKDLDEDHSDGIDKKEFVKYFKEKGFYIDQKILMDIFNQIDFNSNREMSMKEYNRWKQGLPKPIKGKLSQIDEKEDGDTDVYWNNNKKRYEIRIQNDNNNDDDEDDEETKDTEKITITNIEWEKEYGDGWKWAVYAPKLKNKKERLKYKRLGVEVNGYWDVLPRDERERKPACIEYEELSEEHLNIIFQLLHYYYLTQIDVSLQNSNRYKRDNSVLKQIYFAEKDKLNEDEVEELRKFTEREVIICIEENEYELIWWNGKGKHEANAITIINHTAHKQRTNAFHSKHDNNNKSEPEPKEISYLRFDSNVKGLEWKWYDNDSSSFRPMGEYKNDDDETECYMPLIWQLDCTFLANAKHNFVPSIFDEQFGNSWLPKLSYFTKNILNLPGGCDDYIFHATFNKLNEILVNMEQKGFKWSTRSFFTRNLKRMVDGRDSLLTYFRDMRSLLFVERWKQNYCLYTPSQQHFFFLCILSVATEIKYIDIEFENQPVLIPYQESVERKENDDAMSAALIDCSAVRRYIQTYNFFQAFVIPPNDIFRALSDFGTRDLSTSDILQKTVSNGIASWMQRGEASTDTKKKKTAFNEEEVTFLRFVECIRKYLMDSENFENMLWPWYRNSFHCRNPVKYHDTEMYNELMTQYNLCMEFPLNEIKIFVEEQNLNKPEQQSKTKDALRVKRQFAAIQLLNEPDIKRNLHIIKHQLGFCLDSIMDDIFNEKDVIKDKDESFKILYKLQWEDNAYEMLKDINKYKINWKEQVKIANEVEFRNQFNKSSKYKVFNQNLQNVEFIDITEITLALFEQFVFELFVDSDKEIYDKHATKPPFIGVKEYCYRMWIEDWRDIPDWYRYRHDILLLELVMRNGINTHHIINDLNGEKNVEYKLRLKKGDENDATFPSFVDNSYYAFKTWCKQRINILHRLKHVTNIIVMNLQKDEYKPSLIDILITEKNKEDRPVFDGNSLLFSHYQIAVIDTDSNAVADKSNEDKANEDKANEDKANEDKANDDHDGDDDKGKMYHVSDPFLLRNIDDEMVDSLKAFDLLKYGESFGIFVINLLQKEQKESYWKILGALLNILRDESAMRILMASMEMNIMQHAKPDTVKALCMKWVKGREFKTSAALRAAEVFRTLAENDIIQEKQWNDIGIEFEKMAYDEINRFESNNLIFVLLSIPLEAHYGVSLVRLALDQHRLSFLNFNRIADTIHHMYSTGFLEPEGDCKVENLSSTELLQLVLLLPFKFYLTPHGYHLIGAMLFVVYLVFVYIYASERPLSGDMNDKTVLIECILWICNIGYIVYEVFEFFDKGMGEYFNWGIKGQTNLMDSLIVINWIFLGSLRAYFIAYSWDFAEGQHANSWQNVYLFLFGLQITVLTLRCLSLFNNSQYIGPLLRTIKLIFIEVFKFMVIFLITVAGILFGLWFIVVAADQSDEIPDLWDGFIYVFQVFIGSADLGDVEGQRTAVIFMIFGTIFGALILTNLLIALMNTEYEKAYERAKQEVVFNQTELTYDIYTGSRLMPPPLNIIVFCVTGIVWICNLIISLISPKCNIYAYLNHDLFVKLQRCTIFCYYGKENNDKAIKPSQYFQTMNRKQVCQWFCGNKAKNEPNELHKGCYAELRLHSPIPRRKKNAERSPINGILMSEYLQRYEAAHNQINSKDKRLLIKLTTKTLFCRKCYRPYLIDKVDDKSDKKAKITDTSFAALLDLISVLIFVIVPIAWIPLIVIFCILASLEKLSKCFDDNTIGRIT